MSRYICGYPPSFQNFCHSAAGLAFVPNIPGIVNRTFENRTQSNSIRGLIFFFFSVRSILFGCRTQSNSIVGYLWYRTLMRSSCKSVNANELQHFIPHMYPLGTLFLNLLALFKNNTSTSASANKLQNDPVTIYHVPYTLSSLVKN